METLLLIVVVLLPLVGLAFGAMATSDKKNAFVRLGDIRGKPLDEIVAAVGPPNSISAHPDGSLYQWLAVHGGSSYHYAILFDRDRKAIGYTHQHVS
jgi:hypothetical protein